MNTYDAGLLRATEHCDTDDQIVAALKRHAVGSRDLMADAFCDLADHLDLDVLARECEQVLLSTYPEATLVTHIYSTQLMMGIGKAIAEAWEKTAHAAIDEDAEGLVHRVRYLRAVRGGAIEQAEKLEDARYVA